MSNSADKTVAEIYGRQVQGDIGIELEVEGKKLSIVKSNGGSPTFWFAKGEDSLRGGMEYVLNRPICREELEPVLTELEDILSTGQISNSIRCSTHIHINACPLSMRELYNFYAYYYLIENLLVGAHGQHRIGNLHCLRMSDAESIAIDLAESWETERYISAFGHQGSFKYGALNLAAASIYGSLEFRFLSPLVEMDEMYFWVSLLFDLVNNAKKIPIDQTLLSVETNSFMGFLGLTMTESQINHVVELYTKYNDTPLTDVFDETLHHIHELNLVMSKKKEKPRRILDKDTKIPITQIGQGVSFTGEVDPFTFEPTPGYDLDELTELMAASYETEDTPEPNTLGTATINTTVTATTTASPMSDDSTTFDWSVFAPDLNPFTTQPPVWGPITDTDE